ncbi:MAG: SLBB domain-containing protein [Deltaproteobacteria bacterium]|nr:SLBB domain-containing protein [Deltaproteobacteria bacterium]
MSDITIRTIAEAGVVGAGGAGFPTHVKLSGRADSVILNAAECEPLLHKDKEILRRHTELVIEGLSAAIRFVGAERGFVGIKEKYSGVIDLLRSKLPPHITIAPLLDVYPAGDEFVLVYDVLGRVIPPGGLPLHVGAVVMNVETAFNVAGSPKHSVTEKFLTVAGAVANPITLRVPIGAPLSACVEAAGGSTVADANYIVGGVMMGYLEENRQAPVDKTTGGIVVLPDDHVVVRRRRRTQNQMDRIGRSACDQCCFCTELCPRYLLGHPLEPHRAMRSLMFNLIGEANVLGTAYCCECNLCSLYSCPEDLDPKDVCAKNKKRLASEGKRWEAPPFNPKRPEMLMANRKAPMRRLMLKLGLTGFRNVGPLREDPLSINRVGVKLKQHIGAPCEPLVEVGREVHRGEVIGRPKVTNGKPALGAPVHASIDGNVTAISDGVVWIEKF